MSRTHKDMATRKSSQVVMSEFGHMMPELIGLCGLERIKSLLL